MLLPTRTSVLALLGFVCTVQLTVGCSDRPGGAPQQEKADRTTAVRQDAQRRERSSDGARASHPHIYSRVATVSIGINDYQDIRVPDLSFAESDAKSLADLLGSVYAYDTAATLLGKAATKARITDMLRDYSQTIGPTDVLIIYFAGHGKVVKLPDFGEAGYLLPYDARLDFDAELDPEAWRAQAIEMRALVSLVRGMRARHVVVIADACCSGFMTKRGGLTSRVDLQMLLTEPSRTIVAASTERQSAKEDWTTGHGYFSKALMEQLKRAEVASVTDVFVEVRKNVAAAANQTMIPQMANVGEGNGEFVFIPRSIPEEEIKVAMQGGIGHALAGVVARSVRRSTQQSQEAEVFVAAGALDYRFSQRPREGETLWAQRFARFLDNGQIGDVNAMAGLSYCYAKGLGVTKDERTAARWARLAYDSDRPIGKHVYAECLMNGTGIDRNEQAAERIFEQAANAGCALSQLKLSELAMTRGQSAEGLRLLESAAKLGLSDAKVHLGRALLGETPGVPANIARAEALLTEAAREDRPEAKFQLYLIYGYGRPGHPAKDVKKAKEYLVQAAEAGLGDAQHYLAQEYAGFGNRLLDLARDDRKTKNWLELACAQENPQAMTMLATLLVQGSGMSPEPERAKHLCEAAAAKHCVDAITLQGVWYAEGRIYPQDDKRAVERFRVAANAGHPIASYALATMYNAGLGIDLDPRFQGDAFHPASYVAYHWLITAYHKFKVDPQLYSEQIAEIKKCLTRFKGYWRLEAEQGIPYGGAISPTRIAGTWKKEFPSTYRGFNDDPFFGPKVKE